jgi:hypothetical protein
MGGPNRSTVSMLGAALSTTAAGFARRMQAVLCAAALQLWWGGVVCQRIRTVPPFQMLERNPLECDS